MLEFFEHLERWKKFFHYSTIFIKKTIQLQHFLYKIKYFVKIIIVQQHGKCVSTLTIYYTKTISIYLS